MISPSSSSILPFLSGWAPHLVCEPHGSGSRGTLTQWISPLQWMGFGTAGEMSSHIELTFEVPENCMARNAIHCLFLWRRLKNSCLPISCAIHALSPVELYRASLERANREGKEEWAVCKEILSAELPQIWSLGDGKRNKDKSCLLRAFFS